MGKLKYFWPDWSMTHTLSENTRTSRKPERLRGRQVTPLPVYSFHTPFTIQTDGKQWVIGGYSRSGAIRAAADVLTFIGVSWFLIFTAIYLQPENKVSIWVGLVPILIATPFLIWGRFGGEDTWVVFDRTTGNVCFWRKNKQNSLVVPFDQVQCYWIEVFRRGVSHSLYFMPEVNLPNERHRWWKVEMGFPTQYQQAQYFWRVLTDFMDRSRPIPEVPGLIHQVRSMEKKGYTIQDITEGGKEITDDDFMEVQKEIQNDMAALEARLDRIMEADQFSADALIQFYENAPVYAVEKVLQTVKFQLELWVDFLKQQLMEPEFRDYYSLDQYKAEINKLVRYFDPVFEALSQARE